MRSFRISVTPHRRAAARFVRNVHVALQKAFADNPTVSQTDLANAIGVNRSVINRQIKGFNDMSLGRVAELSHLLGYEPRFELVKAKHEVGCNVPPQTPFIGSGVKIHTGSTSQGSVLRSLDARPPMVDA